MLSAPVKEGTGGLVEYDDLDSSGALPLRDSDGTVLSGSVALGLGVLSASIGSVTSIRTPLF